MDRQFSIRFVAMLAALLSATAASEARRVGLAGGSRFALAAAVMAAGCSMLFALTAVAPGMVLVPFARSKYVGALSQRLAAESDSPNSSRLAGWGLVCLVWGTICFGVNLWNRSLDPPYFALDDQGAYLERARSMERTGGPLVTVPQAFDDLRSGRLREDNRHPLYLTLLACHPEVAFGRALSEVFGIAAFVLTTWMVWRRFDGLTAGMYAVLLGVNRSLAEFSVMVVCESLLTLWVAMAYFVLLPRRDASASAGRKRWRILQASLLLGLAYLTKATGLLFFGVFLLWLAWQARPRRGDHFPPDVERDSIVPLDEPDPFRQWVIALLCGVVGFVFVSEPLLERNWRVFGNPFHNVNSLLLFADEYSEFNSLLKMGTTTGEAAKAYLETHSVGVMLGRELNGLVWETLIVLRTLGPTGLDEGRLLFGIPIAMLAALSLWFERRPARWLLMMWTIACWVMFAWYVPIAAGDRFPLPLLLPILAHAADGAARITRAIWTQRTSDTAVPQQQ